MESEPRDPSPESHRTLSRIKAAYKRRRTEGLVRSWEALGGWIVFALMVTAFIGWSYFNGRIMTRIAQQDSHPAERLEMAKEILGAKGLPPGYYPGKVFVMALSPFLFGEEITLTDRPPNVEGGIQPFQSAGFVYAHFPDEKAFQLKLMRDLVRTEMGLKFQGWSQEVGLEGREHITKGEMTIDDRRIEYVSQRGIVIHRDGHYPSIYCVMAIHCPDERTRGALWFGPDISGKGKTVSEATFVTGPANPESIRSFMTYFDLCEARTSE